MITKKLTKKRNSIPYPLSGWSFMLGYVSNFLVLRHMVDFSHIVGVIKAKWWRRKELETQKKISIYSSIRYSGRTVWPDRSTAKGLQQADRDYTEDRSTARDQLIDRCAKHVLLGVSEQIISRPPLRSVDHWAENQLGSTKLRSKLSSPKDMEML